MTPAWTWTASTVAGTLVRYQPWGRNLSVEIRGPSACNAHADCTCHPSRSAMVSACAGLSRAGRNTASRTIRLHAIRNTSLTEEQDQSSILNRRRPPRACAFPPEDPVSIYIEDRICNPSRRAKFHDRLLTAAHGAKIIHNHEASLGDLVIKTGQSIHGRAIHVSIQ